MFITLCNWYSINFPIRESIRQIKRIQDDKDAEKHLQLLQDLIYNDRYLRFNVLPELLIVQKVYRIRKETKKQSPVCRQYVLRGFCWYDNKCRYQHSKDLNVIKLTECKYKDTCRHQNCPFGHNLPDPNTDNTCSICQIDIVKTGNRFGLIKCNHIFCHTCITQWKKTKVDLYQRVNRFPCPICRASCLKVLSSDIYLKEEEQAYVYNRKAKRCATKPCKYGPRHNCPFREMCHYLHID